jgi:predicted nucleic acid-binding protein
VVAYFDTSVLLSILLDEAAKDESYHFWTSAETRVSSILLKIETITVLRQTYEHHKSALLGEWLSRKTGELEEFLKEVNYRFLDEEIEQSITRKKELSLGRVHDAIHLATALEFAKLVEPKEFRLYSYDSAMLDLARHYKLSTNKKKSGSW